MIFYSGDKLLIRTMIEEDVPVIVKEEIAQGWQANKEKYETRIKDMANKKSIAITAEYCGNIAGYINVYFFGDCPEIVDFGVLEKYQRKGIGTKLMDIAEMIAFKNSNVVFLAVGLHSGYGSAQRMYVKRGYIPDGKGIYYGDKPCIPYKEYLNDDCLLLKFSKTRERSSL